MDVPVQEDGLKWFGEGFDGFPKRLPDDCVEYAIYVIDDNLRTIAAKRERLKEILKASNELTRRLLREYIWQRDAFGLHLQPSLDSKPSKVESSASDRSFHAVPFLKGRTSFGDSVADEWLVVYLLHELSKQFPDAFIRVYDADGEFLLIEAAKALPKWLNPDIAENRVWLSNGHIKLIPLFDVSSPTNISLEEALDFIEHQPDKSVISPFVEDEAFHRLRDYPSAITASLHHALIVIPRTLAYVLHRKEAYISPAIEAFYLRDPVSLRPLSTKDIASLHFPPEDFVTVSTKFTKVGYAQLRSQVFDPPSAWTGVIPRMNNARAELGMKLSCGFEMLMGDPQNQNNRSVREIKLLLHDVKGGDDSLPSDGELASWPQVQDDEKWLDIDFEDFENVLSGKKSTQDASAGSGGADPHDNMRNMISRFQDFLQDDTAGVEGVEDVDENDTDSSTDSAEGQDPDLNEEDFSKAMKEVQQMRPGDIESKGLLDEARRLAIEDAEDQSDVDEDEEMKKVMGLMERELKSHGALDLKDKSLKAAGKSAAAKPMFGPERPPHMQSSSLANTHASNDIADEQVELGDGELSSDDEDFNDIDLGLANNLLESFKGQVGLAGPAGNLMKSMGLNMPRDEGDESD